MKDYTIFQNDKLQLSFLAALLAGGLATHGSAGGAQRTPM
jgi:hypothetical protein